MDPACPPSAVVPPAVQRDSDPRFIMLPT